MKGAKMMEFIKTWGQHPDKFIFDHFFNAVRVIRLCLKDNDGNLGGVLPGGHK